LHEEPLETRLPIISAGEETTLRAEEIEWVPFVIRPAQVPEPVQLSQHDLQKISELPIRKDLVFEMIVPLVPEMSFLDEKAGRPCLARAIFIVERRSRFVLCAEVAHGAKPLNQTIGPALVKTLLKAKGRPAIFRVDNVQLAATLAPPCEQFGVRVENTPLEVAPDAWAEFEAYLQTQRPH
jgi:hypothetical protein